MIGVRREGEQIPRAYHFLVVGFPYVRSCGKPSATSASRPWVGYGLCGGHDPNFPQSEEPHVRVARMNRRKVCGRFRTVEVVCVQVVRCATVDPDAEPRERWFRFVHGTPPPNLGEAPQEAATRHAGEISELRGNPGIREDPDPVVENPDAAVVETPLGGTRTLRGWRDLGAFGETQWRQEGEGVTT